MQAAFDVGRHDALVIVDVQNDFLPGGALAVSEGDQVVPVINDLMRVFRRAGRPIFATRDWHPANHCSFKSQGGPWPVHCVQGTSGAEFASGLDLDDDVVIVSKDFEQDVNAYSGFERTDLAARLRDEAVERVVVVGLATDYCVLSTALSAVQEGFDAVVVEDAVRAVDVVPGDGEAALAKMRQAGVTVHAVQKVG